MAEEIEILKNIFNNSKKEIIIFLVVFVLIISNIVFGVLYYSELKECESTKLILKSQQTNSKVVNFSRLFIEKVLKAQNEVSFEERLKLENAVRELDDKEILTQWEKFTSSKTEAEAQTEVKNLLSLLVSKISIAEK